MEKCDELMPMSGSCTARMVYLFLSSFLGNHERESAMPNGSGGHTRAAIRPVKESVEDQLLAQSGVVGVDIGEKVSGGEPTGELGIIVYVREKKSEDELDVEEVVPKVMDGVRTDVQELVVELQPAMQPHDVSIPVEEAASTTLYGGISMGPSRRLQLAPPVVEVAGEYGFVGTLGAIVRDRRTGVPMALTNFHVACIDDGCRVGDRMVQPGIPDGGDPQTQEFGSLTRARLTENTDGAVITLDPGREWQSSVQGIGDVAGVVAAMIGATAQKCGRTTGCTYGTVGSTDATLSLDYGDGIGVRTLRRQVRIDTDASQSPRFSEQGDSGSVIMDMQRRVLGLLFGGSTDGSTTFANPITVALDELDADLAVGNARETGPSSHW